MKRDWSKIGSKLEGKIHIYIGEADNYFLNNAVYLVDDFLKTTRNPTTAAKSTTNLAPSTAGAATTRAQTQSPDSAATSSTHPRSSNEF
jgi:hypothetical protein